MSPGPTISLKDLRRLAAAEHVWGFSDLVTTWARQAVIEGLVPGWGRDKWRAIDRLISLHGPDCPWPIKDAAPAKGAGKKEGAPCNGDKSATSIQPKEAGKDPERGATGSEGEEPADEAGGSHPSGGESGDNPSGPDGAVGDPAARVAPGSQSEKAASGDNPPDGRADAARPDEGAGAENNLADATPRVEGGDNTSTHSDAVSATTGDASVALEAFFPKADREARRLARAIMRLVRRLAPGTGVPTPKLHHQLFARELVSKRCALSRCRREMESEVVATDVSGSCSKVAAHTLAAARMMASGDPRIVVVAHHNGHPMAAWGPLARRVRIFDGVAEMAPVGDEFRFAVDGPVAVMVAFGDCDAEDVYRHRATLHPVVWLDHFASKRGAVRVAEEGALTRITGVGNIGQAVAASRLLQAKTLHSPK